MKHIDPATPVLTVERLRVLKTALLTDLAAAGCSLHAAQNSKGSRGVASEKYVVDAYEELITVLEQYIDCAERHNSRRSTCLE